jgi:hypothetical protein
LRPYYQDDAVTIYHGRCEQVMNDVAPYCDHVLTDPPYARDVYTRLRAPNTKDGSGTPGRLGIRNHQCSSNSIAKLAAGDIGAIDELIIPVGTLIGALCKRWALVFSDAESTHLWRESLTKGSMRYVRTGAWVKPDPMPQFSGDRPCVGFEPCTIAHAQGAMRWNGGGTAAVWTYNTVKGGTTARHGHPCPKPEPLMAALVRLFTDPGDMILDPFMGSGTTLAAAKRLGRKAIGIEMAEEHCEAATKRLMRTTKADQVDLLAAVNQ